MRGENEIRSVHDDRDTIAQVVVVRRRDNMIKRETMKEREIERVRESEKERGVSRERDGHETLP